MQKCEFEEKQYEQHLNNELLLRKKLLYVPGQVLEGTIGFDAALYSTNRRFWELFIEPPFMRFFWSNRVRRNRPGIQLCREWWSELETGIEYFPPFRFNVFLQHKRPDYLDHPSSGEWAHWLCPYFRYAITPHQQKALEQLEHLTNKSAIVAYASPAFVKSIDLWRSIDQGNLIETSNFCQPVKLAGHQKYSYKEAGNQGKGHSDAEDIESFGFYNRVEDFFELAERAESNRGFLIHLGSILAEAIDNCGELTTSFASILNTFEVNERDEFYLAMARISAFVFVVNVRWTIAVVRG